MSRLVVPARVGAALAALLFFAAPALAGPPWISVEIPANPHMREARGALLLVRAYHHSSERAFRVTGVARGRVDGERVSVPLTLSPTGRAGVYAVARPDLAEGRWVLVLNLHSGGDTDATALVTLDAGGEVSGVRVPTSERRIEGFTIPRPASDAEIEALLSGDGLADVDPDGPGGGPLAAAAGLAALAIAIPLARRRRR